MTAIDQFLADRRTSQGASLDALGAAAGEAEAARHGRGGRRTVLPALLGGDALALLGAAAATEGALACVRSEPVAHQIALSALFVPVFLCVMAAYGLYRRSRRRLIASTFPDMPHLFHAVLLATIVSMLVSGPLHRVLPWDPLTKVHLVLAGALSVVFVPVARLVTRWALRPPGRASRVLVVGSGVVAGHVVSRLASVDRCSVLGYVDDEQEAVPGLPEPMVPRLGSLEDLPAVVAARDIDHVIVAFTSATGARLAGALRSLANEVQISVVPRLFDLLTVRSRVDDLHGLAVVDVAPAALGPADRILKRTLDVAVSACLLVVLAPVLLTAAALVKLTSPGPVLFRQTRTGRAGRPFTIYKFRSMARDAERDRDGLASANEVDGPLFKVRADTRVTRVGRVIRATSIDELPQLLNVLLGTMSLVGPRPFVTSESEAIDGWAARRFDVKPGMTGLWQTCGRSDLPFEELCRLDWSYVASWSLWWDLRIMWHTPAAVLRRRGAY